MAGHDHFDAGHFEIARDGGLAIDAGTYEGGDSSPNSHDTKYYQRTISHNTVTVFDPSEVWDDYYGRYTTNDGGQKWSGDAGGSVSPDSYSDFVMNGRFDRGGVEIFEKGDDFVYISADVTPAYSNSGVSDLFVTKSAKMELFTREIVFADEKYFAIFDKVKTSDAAFEKRWLLHFVNEPEIDGNFISSTNRKSKLGVKSLLPLEKLIFKRGGAGFEYWTGYDDLAENPEFNADNHGRYPNEPGAWRIEISPMVPEKDNYFLNILFPAEKEEEMPEVLLVESNGMKGAFINDSSSPFVIMFSENRDETVNSEIEYSLTYPEQLLGKHLLTKVPEGSYRVYKDDLLIAEGLDVSKSGALYFESNGGGRFKVEKF